ncbi:MAG: ArsR family transcriptional regulator [Actinomycetota bacterium]|nr:ArsR family transcriptional regulator [Actinomycetota bacterium]
MGTRPHHVDPAGGALLRAKAQAAPTRVEILRLLGDAARPLTAGDLASAIGIHHTAVRQHVAMLVEAGMVRSEQLPVVGRGRPRTGYVALPVATGGPYRELAGMLAGAVRDGRTAREAGRESGRQVQVSPEGALATLRDEAQRLGFDPLARRRGEVQEVVLRTCPFADLASTQPDTVCELHVGLAEGIAEAAGGFAVEGIHMADPRKGGCRIVVRELPPQP